MAGQLAEDDLSVRTPETGIGEIGALERAFNTMGSSLEASHAELRKLAGEQAALRRVATLVARGKPPSDVLDAVAEEASRLLDPDATGLLRYEPDGTATVVAGRDVGGGPGKTGTRLPPGDDGIIAAVLRTGRAARVELSGDAASIPEWLRELGFRSGVGAPIVVEGRLWGVMIAAWTAGHQPPPDAEPRMTQFTELVATAIANAQSRAELTASRARVVATADETRRRIERDLHDGAQQRLVHSVITLKLARQALADTDGPAAELVDEALEHAERASTELRELAHGILPAVLTRGGLRAGVEALVSRVPLAVSVDIPAERLAPALEATAYFIVAEALTNVVKHANARSAEVKASVDGDVLHLEVRDDGAGGARIEGGSGLLGLRDRAAAMNGTLHVDSPRGDGTVLAVTLPVNRR